MVKESGFGVRVSERRLTRGNVESELSTIPSPEYRLVHLATEKSEWAHALDPWLPANLERLLADSDRSRLFALSAMAAGDATVTLWASARVSSGGCACAYLSKPATRSEQLRKQLD